MKSVEELAQRWGRKAVKFPEAPMRELEMPDSAAAALTGGALPREGAPFLSFGSQYTSGESRRSWVPTVAETFGLEDESLDAYGVIGTDGAGSPVAVNLDDGSVVVIDHEGDFSSTPMNPNVLVLARCMQAYAGFVDAVRDELGPHGYIDGLYSADHVQALADELHQCDPAALEEGSFWANDLRALRANAG
jgi:hypothetical protein